MCDRVHVVPCGDAVQYIGLEHGVVGHAGQRYVIASEDMRVVLEVVPDLLFAVVFEPVLEFCQHGISWQLIGCAGIVMGQRYVARIARRNSQ